MHALHECYEYGMNVLFLESDADAIIQRKERARIWKERRRPRSERASEEA